MNRENCALLILALTLFGCGHAPSAPEKVTSSKHLDVDSNTEAIVATKDSEEAKQKNYFDWPVDSARMTRGYLPNRKRPHLGLDLAGPKGTKIFAAHDGTVIYTGREFHGYGRMIMVEGNQGWATLYAHLSKIIAKEGQRVSQGDLIGLMGRTGHATGTHLHFEIRKGNGTVDPLFYMPKGSLAGK